MMSRFVRSATRLAAGICVLAAAGAGVAQASGLVPHRAVYAMSMVESREGSDISAVSGRLVLEWSGSACEGYVTSQRIVNRMGSKQGSGFVSDFRVNSWEAADGSDFTFSMIHYVDGTTVEEIEGRAVRDRGRASVAFTSPEERTLDLPAGVVFPTEQVQRMLAAAVEGRRVLSTEVFDGSETDHHFATTTFFGPGAEGGPEGDEATPGAALDALSYWPVQVSYFDPRSASGLPDYEVSFRFYSNGVSTGLIMDYGDLVIAADLIELDLLPVPDC